MEQTLDAKAERTDAEWAAFIGSPEYRVSVQKQITTLNDMISNLRVGRNSDEIRRDAH